MLGLLTICDNSLCRLTTLNSPMFYNFLMCCIGLRDSHYTKTSTDDSVVLACRTRQDREPIMLLLNTGPTRGRVDSVLLRHVDEWLARLIIW